VTSLRPPPRPAQTVALAPRHEGAGDDAMMNAPSVWVGPCWLCAGWVEVPIKLWQGISIDPGIKFEDGEVFAFLSFDNFSRPVPLSPKSPVPGEEDIGMHCWEGARWLPPTEVPYMMVFMVDGQLVTAVDLPQRRLTTPLVLPGRGRRSVTRRDVDDLGTPSPMQGQQDHGVIAESDANDDGNDSDQVSIGAVNLIRASRFAVTRLKSDREADALGDEAYVKFTNQHVSTRPWKRPSRSLPEELRHSRAPPRQQLPQGWWSAPYSAGYEAVLRSQTPTPCRASSSHAKLRQSPPPTKVKRRAG